MQRREEGLGPHAHVADLDNLIDWRSAKQSAPRFGARAWPW